MGSLKRRPAKVQRPVEYEGRRKLAPTRTEHGVEDKQHAASGVVVNVWRRGMGHQLKSYRDVADISEYFNWGYEGSGPAQLALAICCDALGVEIGSRMDVYENFKRDYVANWGPQWRITDRAVKKWYKDNF